MRLQFDGRARRRSSETKNAGRSNLASQFSSSVFAQVQRRPSNAYSGALKWPGGRGGDILRVL
jgi:hypothetical protein